MKKIFAFIISIILIICIGSYMRTQLLNVGNSKQSAEIIKDITFEPYSNQESLKMLVTIENTEDYIDKVKYVNKNRKEIIVTSHGNKNKIAFDYEIVEDGEYNFIAYSKSGEIIEKTLIIDSDFRNIININIEPKTDTELITEADISIDYNNKNIYMQQKYKIGKSTEWNNYVDTFSVNSYQILEQSLQEDDDKTVTVYAKKEDNANNAIIISKATMKFDLDIPNKPIINIEKVADYPYLNEYGYQLNSEIEIEYDDRDDIINYYSLDNGNTWKEYEGKITTENLVVQAKSVKKISGLTINADKRVQPTASDALGSEAYDGNEKTGAKSGKIFIDPKLIGEKLRIYFGSSTGTWGSSGFSICDKDGQNLLSESKNYFESAYDKVITIPENASYLLYTSNSGYNGNPGLLYEMTIQNQAKFNITEILPIIKESGIEKTYNIIDIQYYQTATKKLYKIDDGDWNEYKTTINLELGKTIYAKSVDKYGNETIEAKYFSEANQGLSLEAYDGNEKTGAKSGKIFIDPKLIGEKLRIYFGISTGTWGSLGFSISDKDGQILLSASKNYTNHDPYDEIITIPENASYLIYVSDPGYNGQPGLLYEIKLQNGE